MEKFYRIAGLTVQMNPLPRTAKQAEIYEVFSPEKIDCVLEEKWKEFRNLYPSMSDDDIEYLYSGAVFYKHLMDYNGMMLHSSAVVVDNRAYLFTADCGTGKSTHTALWLKLFGDRAYILNDDKPALRLEDGIWYAYGTPWSGKSDLSVNARVPLAGIAVLERSVENSIEHFGGIGAISSILAQLNKVRSREYREKQMDLLGKLLEAVPVWKLKCNMDISAARLSYEAMSKAYEEEKEC